METNIGYDKIKHLVDVEDHILAVFTMNSAGKAENLNIAKDMDVNKDMIEKIIFNVKNYQNEVQPGIFSKTIDEIGELKWKIFEYEGLRILQVFDSETVVVLIKTNTSLYETVDNILGYYYEEENIPKSLF